ncbi:MAG: hypothetical protein AAF828_09835, partial [Bacteroidota bacterium]
MFSKGRSQLFLLALLALVFTGRLAAQEELFTNRIEGTPLTVSTLLEVEDDKASLSSIYPGVDNPFYVHNRLIWNLSPNDNGQLPAGTYTILLDIRYWLVGEDVTQAAPNSQLQEMTIVVGNDDSGLPQTYFAFDGAAKLEVEIDNVTLNDIPIIGDSPRMELIGEIAIDRNLCNLNCSQSLAPVSAQNIRQSDGSFLGVNVSPIMCADEYDVEWTFFDEDSEVGRAIAGQGSINPTLDELFRHDASRMTSSGTLFRLFALYRTGYVMVRWRAVQYQDGRRVYTRWSTHNRSLQDGYPTILVGHEVERNWQATTNFAEDAKQLPSIAYMDGTLRGRQNLTLQHFNQRAAGDPLDEYAISQQTIFDAMGRPSITTLPAPIIQSVDGNGQSNPTRHPLGFAISTLAVTNDNANLYGQDEVEASAPNTLAQSMGTATGAGRYYSPSNDMLARNAFVPDGAGYPFSVTRYIDDNTGRIRRQGGVGDILQAGGGHDTRYYYGKPNQWELDRLFGVNVGWADHYEKNVVVDPNGQASVSYLDSKGRVIATALTGTNPDNVEALTAETEAVSNQAEIEVDFLNNVMNEDGSLLTTYTLLVGAPSEYDICYALKNTQGCVDCPEDMSSFCVDCEFEVTLGIAPVDAYTQINGQDVVTPREVDHTRVTTIANFADCFTNPDAAQNSTLFNLDLDVGEYRIYKETRISEIAVNENWEAFLATESCLRTEADFIQEYVDAIDLTACDSPCNCATPYYDLSDECKAYCQPLTPCEVIRTQLYGDLSPGGQYATYTIATITNEQGQEVAEYTADEMEHPLSIFAETSLSSNIAYYKTLDYGDAMVLVDGALRNPQELSIEEFIINFDEAWLPTLLAWHPEACLLEWCDANLDQVPANYTISSNTFDLNIRSIDHYQTAVTRGYINSSLVSNFFDQSLSLNHLLQGDPYQNGGNILLGLQSYNDPGNSISDVFDIIRYHMETQYGTPWVFATANDYQRDEAWRIYRNYYLVEKSKHQLTEQANECNGSTGVHTNFWRCLDQPICASLDCDAVEGHCVEPYTNYIARVSTNFRLSASTGLGTSGDSPLPFPMDSTDLYGPLADSVESNCTTACAGYLPVWRTMLLACSELTEADRNSILSEFELICQAGCTEGNFWGTSTVVTNTTGLTFTSFSDVVDHYLTQNDCDDLSCNPFLVNVPPPSGTLLYGGHFTIPAPDVPGFLVANASWLTNQFQTYIEPCYCGNVGAPLQGTPDPGISACNIQRMADLNRMDFDALLATLQIIEAFIDHGIDGPDAAFDFSAVDLILPPELMPEGDFCITCSELDALITNFGLLNICQPNHVNYEDFRTEYLNAQLGWNRTTEEYNDFSLDCKARSNNCLICADPPANQTANTPISCVDVLTALATEEGRFAYQRYLATEESDFKRRYRADCYEKVDEKLRLRYTPYEYHYTLYYYDQAGNLVMTVPPEGVRPLTDQSLETTISNYRVAIQDSEVPTAPTAVLPQHSMLTHYRYNNFNEVAIRDIPEAEAEYKWYDQLGRITLSRDGRQNLLNRYGYTLYDELGRVTEVGELFSAPGASRQSFVDAAEAGTIASVFGTNLTTGNERGHVTRTYYTDTPFTIPTFTNGQQNLRNRVAGITFEATYDNNGTGYDYASHYSYDAVGNVDFLTQEFQSLNATGHRYKTIEYDYDFISGNVHAVFYQRGMADQFTYRYEYDKTNRLIATYTSEVETEHPQTALWKRDVAYTYYDHGPLKRTILGQDRLQGLDYAYTIHGWIKGMNGSLGDEFDCVALPDMGSDGSGVGAASPYRDLYRYANQYFDQDYTPIGEALVGGNPFYNEIAAGPNGENYNLYNGNIFRHFKSAATDGFRTLALVGCYDQLHRLTWSGNNFYDDSYGSLAPYVNNVREAMQYDGNGNIESMVRSFQAKDPSFGDYQGSNTLTYSYPDASGIRDNNLLQEVMVATTNTNPNGFQPVPFIEEDYSFQYDGSGNIIRTFYGTQRTDISWNPYGKVINVLQVLSGGGVGDQTTFNYGPDQNRWKKTLRGPVNDPNAEINATYYVRDAQGNVLATYTGDESSGGALTWSDQFLFGSSRLGAVAFNRSMVDPTDLTSSNGALGTRRYELTNHLGNVPITFSERAVAYTDANDATYQAPKILSHQDYTAFGLEWHRSPTQQNGPKYRYGFNGKEADRNGEWGGLTHYDYGFRIYNPTVARFLSVDPLAP